MDRASNVGGERVDQQESQETRPARAAEEAEAAEEGLPEERPDSGGGTGYTQTGKHWDRVKKAES